MKKQLFIENLKRRMNELNKKLSILLLIYNVDEYLDKYVDNLIKTCGDKEYEIILLDKGSTDKSSEFCLMWQKKNNNCVYVQTYSDDDKDCIRFGAHIAAGEYFCYITSDEIKNNIIPENLFEKLTSDASSLLYSNKTYNRPFITIVITSYNKEMFVQRAIQSVKNMNYSEWECIIVDNSSTDNTLQIVLENIKNDNRFKLISQTNKNVCHARNIGAFGGIGKYLTFLDADDEIGKDYCSKAIEEMEKNKKICISTGCFTRFYLDGSTENFKTYAYLMNTMHYKHRIKTELACNQFTVTSIFKMDRFKKIKGFRIGTEYTQEDWEMIIRYFYYNLNEIDVYFIDDFVLNMYSVENSKTKTQNKNWGNNQACLLEMYNENPDIYEKFFSVEEIEKIKNLMVL